ncbi:MAG: hypothetical protein JNL82_30285 [Myxococcales bacterium]|nr:hypothetical protein [Myxococcales bacterium]
MTATDNSLMLLLLRRCGLDERAVPLLAALEQAAWRFIGETTSVERVREVLALIDGEVEAWAAARAAATPAERELLRAMIRARAGEVPADVVAGFTADAVRVAILIEDAFRRGHELALDRPPRAPRPPRERRVRLAH